MKENAATAKPTDAETPTRSAKADRRARSAVPTPDEAREWLNEHMANAPERSEQWYREVLAIYRAGRREAIAEQAEGRVP